VVQRVSRAEVRVEGRPVGAIGPGLVVLVGVALEDTAAEADVLADRLAGLRIFRDEEGRMNRSVAETSGGVLVVSQFTLLADARKGRRPSFTGAAPPERAAPLVRQVAQRLGEAGLAVAEGSFGAMMEVDLVNDGPVTIVLDVVAGRVV
jgi:D-tyrosyl-tRNA(Tyr) deacylase